MTNQQASLFRVFPLNALNKLFRGQIQIYLRLFRGSYEVAVLESSNLGILWYVVYLPRRSPSSMFYIYPSPIQSLNSPTQLWPHLEMLMPNHHKTSEDVGSGCWFKPRLRKSLQMDWSIENGQY
mmetsp:Transcript_9077/g.12909  ORF Transcript_9077/g.12909 Transcript_9077/m.12909 type:complete len:124 (-) Transcript_9077:392-763(-)